MTADDGWSELAALYREHARSLVRLAALLVDDVGVAEEIVQDAFMLVQRRWRRVERPEAYLTTTVVNLARSRLRRRVVELRHPPLREPHVPPVGEVVVDDVIAALRALPRRQREVLVLRYYADLSEEKIAATLGISAGSVKTHAHRGLTALERFLDR